MTNHLPLKCFFSLSPASRLNFLMEKIVSLCFSLSSFILSSEADSFPSMKEVVTVMSDQSLSPSQPSHRRLALTLPEDDDDGPSLLSYVSDYSHSSLSPSLPHSVLNLSWPEAFSLISSSQCLSPTDWLSSMSLTEGGREFDFPSQTIEQNRRKEEKVQKHWYTTRFSL